MVKQWIDKSRLFIARYKIERFTLSFPNFRATLLLMWIMALFGLGYGHVFTPAPQGRTVSLTLSVVSWVIAVFIVALRNPGERLRLLSLQIMSVVLLFLFLVAAYVSYSFVLAEQNVINSIRYAWVGSSVVLAVLTYRSIIAFFFHLNAANDKNYPGVITAPLLFILLAINAVWWWLVR